MSKALEKRMDDLEENYKALNDQLGKIVKLIERIQWLGTGVGLYFILDNLGFTEALKVAMKVAVP